MSGTHVLAVSCASRPGIVAAVANTLFGEGRNILDAQQCDDILANRFLMRRVFDGGKGGRAMRLGPSIGARR